MFLKGSVLTNTKPWLVSGAIQLMTKKQYREGSASGHMAVAKSFHVCSLGSAMEYAGFDQQHIAGLKAALLCLP